MKKMVLSPILLAITFILASSVILFLNKEVILSKIIEKSFLKAGKPLKFGSYTVFIDRIEGKKLFGIKINDSSRRLEAKSGSYVYMPKENKIELNLADGAIEDDSPGDNFLKHRLTFKEYHTFFKIK